MRKWARRKYKNAMKGKFHPVNPHKYKGNLAKITYRSQSELVFMKRMDESKEILAWASEPIGIRYYHPIEKYWARYYPDFLIQRQNKDGSKEALMIEIKPIDQCSQPVRKKNMQTYMREMVEWTINRAKWKSAIDYCKTNKLKFIVVARDYKDEFGSKFHTLEEDQLEI